MTRLSGGALLPLLLLVSLALASSCGGGGSGAPASGKMDLASAKPAFTITFPPGALQGAAPASIASGDFNADGKTDLLLGAPFADGPNGSRTDAGEAYILYGPFSSDIDLSQREPDVRILGALDRDALGTGVAAGDLNGDGIDDIIFGAPGSNGLNDIRSDMGEAYIVFGSETLPSTIDTRSAEQGFTLQPAEGFSQLGKAFALADVNADGIRDLIAGAPFAGRTEGTPPGSPRTTVGEVYVVYGSQDLTGLKTVVNNEEDVRLSGVNSYDQFGGSVAAADVNGDGVADIIVGASGYDGPGGDSAEAGGVVVFYGGPDLPHHETLNDADLVLTGEDAGDTFGTQLAAADLNNDGRAELIATAPSAAGPNNGRFAAGETAVFDPATYVGPGVGQATAKDAAHIFAPTDGELLAGGLAVSAAGKPRIAMGSTQRSTPDRVGAGWTYLLAVSVGQDVDLASSEASALAIEGAAPGDGLGGALVFADLDGDGKPELLAEAAAGVQSVTPDPNFRGRLYVIRPG